MRCNIGNTIFDEGTTKWNVCISSNLSVAKKKCN